MKRNKLQKFAEIKTFDCVLEYPFGRLRAEGGFPYRGKWNDAFFGNSGNIVLELGCGKGEYTVGLAAAMPDKNFIGIDIKGARLWKGAKQATEAGMGNVAFLRTGIDQLEEFFAPAEVDEIWITFPDPQMQKVRHRLFSARFLQLYAKVLRPGGTIHLKTDSPFLFAFASRLLQHNGLAPQACTADLYASEGNETAKAFQTFYEQQWLSRGMTIKYIRLQLEGTDFSNPEESDIERDTYHSEF